MKVFKRILGTIVIILILAVLGIAVNNVISLRNFYVVADKDFIHPGNDNAEFDQQGFTCDTESGLFLFSGYMKDSSANPVYFLDPDTGKVIKSVYLSNADGTPFQCHAGGIVINGNYFYVAGSRDDCLYVFRRSTLFSAEDGDSVPCMGAFPTKISDEDGSRASFVSKDEARLYVGEFYLPSIPQYWLRENHKIKGEQGTTHAMLFGFDFDDNEELGLCSQPSVAYALPDKVQHAVFDDGDLILSKSFFFAPSIIETTEPVETGTYTIMGAEVPLYSLTSVEKQYAIPMTEGIVIHNDRIYLSTELYNFLIPGIGKLWNAEWCYNIPASIVE